MFYVPRFGFREQINQRKGGKAKKNIVGVP